MTQPILPYFAAAMVLAGASTAMAAGGSVSDEVISKQRGALAAATADKGFGPQAPRDIDQAGGENKRAFSTAPARAQMNLCNIHFHKNAEHKGGEFTRYAGNGDGKGYNSGYRFSGKLTDAERASLGAPIADKGHGGLVPGDTIEVHYVYTTAKVDPGPTLGACLSKATGNPQLRVEAQVFVLVNDDSAANFVELMKVGVNNGYYQAVAIPEDTGEPVKYTGSTTGPSYNEKGSPFQVSWSVRPKVMKVNIKTVKTWLDNNIFKEDHAHGVRNLVMNPRLLSRIN